LTFDVQSDDIGIEWTGELESTDPMLLRFKNRGEWYNPPAWHLRQRLPNMHPVAIATLGLHFHRGSYDALKLGTLPPNSPGGKSVKVEDLSGGRAG
jgi:hypothetical protein